MQERPAPLRRMFAALVIGLFIYIISPVILPVAMGAVFAVLFFPQMARFQRRHIGTRAAAALLSLTIFVVFLLPTFILGFLGARAGIEQLHTLRALPHDAGGSFSSNLVNTPFISGLITRISGWFPVQAQELASGAEDLIVGLSTRLAELLGSLLTHLPSIVLGLVIMVVSTYFFLVDGRGIAGFIRKHSFFSPKQTEMFISSFTGVCRSVILATLVSGLIQALVFSIACVAFGVSSAALIGFIVFIASFVPLVGSAPVTLGIALSHLLGGYQIGGVCLLLIAGVVSIIDNFIKPAFLKGSANLHPLVAFLAVLGGLQMLGFAGVFLGPILAALTMLMVEIWADEDSPTVPAHLPADSPPGPAPRLPRPPSV